MKINIIALIILLCVSAAALLPAAGEDGVSDPGQALIERAVVTYAATGARNEEALAELKKVDSALGEKWISIMDLWTAPVTVNDRLPDDLAQDDSLCLVALGFQLNPDGTMRAELVERLKVLLEAARQYPSALIVCTGGGTALGDPAATEAGRMKEWLVSQGVEPSRVEAEERSLTTAQNAMYTFELLEAKHPRVRHLAIISSDYHIATGALLFGAEAILRDSDIRVVSNAAWRAPSGSLSAMFQAGALIELSGDKRTAYDIYYDNYDIHGLQSLEEDR
ncbi:MAG: YdcF family protein [Clostridiales bacterium]|nr:YdcF family protein [Clostridiales bacterium]